MEGYFSPTLLYLAAARKQTDRNQLEAYRALLAELDLGPGNPVIRREQHRHASSGGTGPGESHLLEEEDKRDKAPAQVQELLADPQFSGGPAPRGF